MVNLVGPVSTHLGSEWCMIGISSNFASWQFSHNHQTSQKLNYLDLIGTLLNEMYVACDILSLLSYILFIFEDHIATYNAGLHHVHKSAKLSTIYNLIKDSLTSLAWTQNTITIQKRNKNKVRTKSSHIWSIWWDQSLHTLVQSGAWLEYHRTSHLGNFHTTIRIS